MFSSSQKISRIFLSCLFACGQIFPYTIIQDHSTLEIKTPQLSERKNLKISLKNGIKALIISDPKISQSAMAVAVSVGSWNDPDNYPGMAHFCEHMLFMGNKKYPEEDEFFRFVNDHGGISNAYTAGDHTVYLFSANNDAFIEGVDRFSHFFIDPLFPESGVKRELNAVDQENDKNIQNDGWRRWMIIKETGNQNHPNSKFSTGTAETLGKIPLNTLKEWYNTTYSSEGMTIVAMSNESPEAIAKIIEEKFESVPKRKHVSSKPSLLTSKEQKGHLITYEPVQDLRVLNLTWELNESNPSDHSDQIIAALLQSRHNGSLFDLLIKEELANSITAGADKLGLHNRFFEIEVALTQTGVKHFDEVIEKVFQYLQLLKQSNIPSTFQKELKTMDVLSYEYQTQQPAFNFISGQMEEILSQPLSTYPDNSYILENYQPEQIKKTLTQLNSDSCIFFLIAKPDLTGITAENEEKWLGGKYSIKAIPTKQLEALNQIALNDQLKLPDPNALIPQNLTLCPRGKDTSIELLVQEPIGKLYFEQDRQFFTPTVSVKLGVRSLLGDQNPQTFAFYDLLSTSLLKKESASFSQAGFAGLNTSIGRDGCGIKLEIEGFSDKGKILWHNLLDGLKKLSLSNEEFDQFKTLLLINYQNQMMAPPYIQSVQKIGYLTRNDQPTPEQLEKGLSSLTLKDFQTLKQTFLENAYFEMYCFGNLTAQDSIDYFETVTDTFNSQPIISELITRSKSLDMAKSGPFKLGTKTSLMGNSALLMLQNKEQGSKAKGSFLVLNQAIKTAFFDTLRTKQQTGYITTSRALDQLGFLQLYLIVQSTTHEPEELVARFELFLEEYCRNIQSEIPKDRFLVLKQEIKKDLLKPKETISNYTDKRFYEAFSMNGKFDDDKKIAKDLDALTYEEFLIQSENLLSRSNDRRIAIYVEGEVQKNKSLRYISTTQESFKIEQDYVSVKD